MTKRHSKEKVLEALENPNFTWRTVKGISEEAGISPQIVSEIIMSQKDWVVESSVPNTSGEALYTTRTAYMKRVNPIKRFLAALKNRGD
ncbi:MAG: hypothetical protein GY737_01575 [Desulfobacteraceae bacterium]|nr:hypothetical protein [Desulfobacteraceae bacterium]